MIDWDEARRLYDSGLTQVEVAALLGTNQPKVSQMLRRMNATTITKGERAMLNPIVPQWSTCPWCRANIRGTTPDNPHMCGWISDA